MRASRQRHGKLVRSLGACILLKVRCMKEGQLEETACLRRAPIQSANPKRNPKRNPSNPELTARGQLPVFALPQLAAVIIARNNNMMMMMSRLCRKSKSISGHICRALPDLSSARAWLRWRIICRLQSLQCSARLSGRTQSAGQST